MLAFNAVVTFVVLVVVGRASARTVEDAKRNLSKWAFSRKLQSDEIFDYKTWLDSELGNYPACHVCSDGPGGFTTTPNVPFFPVGFGDFGSLTCGEMFEYALNGAISEIECNDFIKPFIFEMNCGCATAPTVSPAPTASMNPSVQPSSSPAPSGGPCYFCGAEDKFISWESGATVSIPGFGDDFPCVILQDMAMWSIEFGFDLFLPVVEDEEGPSFGTCADFQAYADECGCPPLVPTISPSPSASPEPSSVPTTTFSPTATPCYVCGSADVKLGYSNNYVEIDPALVFSAEYDDDITYDDDFTNDDFFFPGGKIEIPCDLLQDFPLPINEGDEACAEIQSFARECECPNLDPTASPAPTATFQPSSAPTATPGPSGPVICTCEDMCHGPNSECGCWCDSICKEFQDCCVDVDDHCSFN